MIGRTAIATAIPKLRHGDRLNAAEFERRYDATPSVKLAELIDGVVYSKGDVPALTHGEPHADMTGWLGLYRAYTRGVRAACSTNIRLDAMNCPQPDVTVFIDPVRGGQARIDAEGYLCAAPDLIGEVVEGDPDGTSLELTTKFELYRSVGVREYIVWRVLDRRIDWFARRESGEYEPLVAGGDGILRSRVFPGLWLDAPALINAFGMRILDLIEQGRADPAHAAFVATLNPPAA